MYITVTQCRSKTRTWLTLCRFGMSVVERFLLPLHRLTDSKGEAQLRCTRRKSPILRPAADQNGRCTTMRRLISIIDGSLDWHETHLDDGRVCGRCCRRTDVHRRADWLTVQASARAGAASACLLLAFGRCSTCQNGGHRLADVESKTATARTPKTTYGQARTSTFRVRRFFSLVTVRSEGSGRGTARQRVGRFG